MSDKPDKPTVTAETRAAIAVASGGESWGAIVVRLYQDLAPNHAVNFCTLAAERFYDGTAFHRVIPGFMIQGGDPNSRGADRAAHGTGGPGYRVKAEFNRAPHKRGVLSMARSDDPDSAGSQFFICVADALFLDGQYTAFGEVVGGMDVVDRVVAVRRDARDNPLDAVTMTVTLA